MLKFWAKHDHYWALYWALMTVICEVYDDIDVEMVIRFLLFALTEKGQYILRDPTLCILNRSMCP